MELTLFADNFRNKTVLITGHTGFKGSWLSQWLEMLGANVVGYSIDIPTTPSHFELLKDLSLHHTIGDIRDKKALLTLLEQHRPDFIFHLAAQPIVSTSYNDPIETFSTNAIGTATLLDALHIHNQACVCIVITSDKCYENVEWTWGYRETDQLGGKDPYSASKAAAEIVYHSYFHSFLKNSPIKSATVRAGNVIGGGDWAKDRIVVDTMLAYSQNKSVEIRSPNATRPWQHVLEPLSGYLHLAHQLTLNASLNGESFNFGPRAEQNRSVAELITDLSTHWEAINSPYTLADNASFNEANLLKLNCDKALAHLNWTPIMDYLETVEFTSMWYKEYYQNQHLSTKTQIQEYCILAQKRSSIWTY